MLILSLCNEFVVQMRWLEALQWASGHEEPTILMAAHNVNITNITKSVKMKKPARSDQ